MRSFHDALVSFAERREINMTPWSDMFKSYEESQQVECLKLITDLAEPPTKPVVKKEKSSANAAKLPMAQ